MHYPYYMYFSSVSLLSRNTKFSSSPCTRSLHTSGKDTVLPNRRAIKDVSIVAPVLSDRTATNMHMAGVCLDRRGWRISVTKMRSVVLLDSIINGILINSLA